MTGSSQPAPLHGTKVNNLALHSHNGDKVSISGGGYVFTKVPHDIINRNNPPLVGFDELKRSKVVVDNACSSPTSLLGLARLTVTSPLPVYAKMSALSTGKRKVR